MTGAEDRRSSAAVAHEAEDVRANLAQTLDQLRDNLRPQHVVEEVVGNAKIGANTLADGLYKIARDNPIPAVLIGVGAAMILGVGAKVQGRLGASALPSGSIGVGLPQGRSSRGFGERDLARSSVGRPGLSSASASTPEKVRDTMKYDTSSSSARLLPPAEHSRLSGILDDQPLIIAALGVAVGAAIGAALPSTRMENDWIGSASASVRHTARDMAEDEIDGFVDVAGRTAQSVKESASGFVRDVGDQAKSAIHDLGPRTMDKQPG